MKSKCLSQLIKPPKLNNSKTLPKARVEDEGVSCVRVGEKIKDETIKEKSKVMNEVDKRIGNDY